MAFDSSSSPFSRAFLIVKSLPLAVRVSSPVARYTGQRATQAPHWAQERMSFDIPSSFSETMGVRSLSVFAGKKERSLNMSHWEVESPRSKRSDWKRAFWKEPQRPDVAKNFPELRIPAGSTFF